MLPEVLSVSILHSAGVSNPALKHLVETHPQVNLVGQGHNPEEFIKNPPGTAPDVVLVNTDGGLTLPGWLEALTASLPQTAVLLCSERMEPEFLLQAMRSGIREVLPLPLRLEDFSACLVRVLAARKRLTDLAGSQGQVLVITGNKGGVGATTVAVNLSYALARSQEERVVLVDLGRPYPDVANFLDRDPSFTIFDLIQNQAEMDQAFLGKIVQHYEGNLYLIHGISDFHDQDSINLEGLQKIFAMLKSSFAWIVVDLSHWLDELFLQVVNQADLVLMLTELSVPDLRNLGQLWPLLRQWLAVNEKVKLIVNRYQRGNGLTLGNLEQVLKQKPFFTLPSDFQCVNEAINRGIPVAGVSAKGRFWLSLENLAQQLTRKPGPKAAAATRRWPRFWRS